MNINKIDNDINYDDIPELTKEDFTRGKKNPFAGMFKDGYTIVIEHNDYDEVINVSKKKQPKRANMVKPSCVAENTLIYDKNKL